MLNFKVWTTYAEADILSVNEDLAKQFPNLEYSFDIRNDWTTIELDDKDRELIKFEKTESWNFLCVFDSMAFMKELEAIGS